MGAGSATARQPQLLRELADIFIVSNRGKLQGVRVDVVTKDAVLRLVPGNRHQIPITQVPLEAEHAPGVIGVEDVFGCFVWVKGVGVGVAIGLLNTKHVRTLRIIKLIVRRRCT